MKADQKAGGAERIDTKTRPRGEEKKKKNLNK